MNKKQLNKVNYIHKISIKHVVNDALKKDIRKENEATILQFNQQIKEIERIIIDQQQKGFNVEPIRKEQKKISAQIQLLKKRLDELENLKDGDLFTTGTIDGVSMLQKGDSLKEKLGPVEILSEDGFAKEIYSVL